jgi:RsiW-degrading membrane proteinase PrsW (M82 family)
MANPVPPPVNPRRQFGRSTIIPILGDRSGLMPKANLVPIIATIIAGLALGAADNGALQFIQLESQEAYNRAFQIFWILGGYITFVVNYYIYRLCGREKPWWLLVGVFAVMAVLIWGPLGHVAGLYNDYVDPISGSPMRHVFGAFLGPGLGEEFIKALPVFVLALTARYWKDPLAQRIGVLEPLDGILIGVASAAAFALSETMSGYIWGAMNDAWAPWIADGIKIFCQVPNSTQIVVDDACRAQAMAFAITNGAGDASFAGLVNILSRGLPAIAGHLAYSGVFGYFIGLAVLKPSSAPRLLITGWVTAAFLHGAWDAVLSLGSLLGYFPTVFIAGLIALLSYAYLGSAILKARKMSPTRSQNFATVVAPQIAPAVAGIAPAVAANKPQPQVSPAVAVANKAPTAAAALVLKIGPVTRMVSPGTSIEPMDLGRAGAGRGKAPIAEIVANPGEPGVLGLRNLSDRVYRAKMPTGKTTNVANGQIVRLSVGVMIDFGGIEGVVQAK